MIESDYQPQAEDSAEPMLLSENDIQEATKLLNSDSELNQAVQNVDKNNPAQVKDLINDVLLSKKYTRLKRTVLIALTLLTGVLLEGCSSEKPLQNTNTIPSAPTVPYIPQPEAYGIQKQELGMEQVDDNVREHINIILTTPIAEGRESEFNQDGKIRLVIYKDNATNEITQISLLLDNTELFSTDNPYRSGNNGPVAYSAVFGPTPPESFFDAANSIIDNFGGTHQTSNPS